MVLDATLITDDRRQLPPDYGRLVDPRQLLPPAVRFFEQRTTWRGMAKRAGLSAFVFLSTAAITALGTLVFWVYARRASAKPARRLHSDIGG